MTTYSTVIRSYSTLVDGGQSDTDLSAYERHLVSFLLNTASNAGVAVNRTYGDVREDTLAAVRAHLSNVLWDARHLIDAAAGPRREANVATAIDRAFVILTNI